MNTNIAANNVSLKKIIFEFLSKIYFYKLNLFLEISFANSYKQKKCNSTSTERAILQSVKIEKYLFFIKTNLKIILFLYYISYIFLNCNMNL